MVVGKNTFHEYQEQPSPNSWLHESYVFKGFSVAEVVKLRVCIGVGNDKKFQKVLLGGFRIEAVVSLMLAFC